MPLWRLLGVGSNVSVGGDRAIYERLLHDGTRLRAYVGNEDGRPTCYEITATFPNRARDFGREIAISELERVINDNELHRSRDARTGEFVSDFSLFEIPVDVPVRGSRGRPSGRTDAGLAELVRDLEDGNAGHYHLERNTIRQYANKAVRRGLAEVADEGPPKTWRLTAQGRRLIGD